jgi:hypothetical protein
MVPALIAKPRAMAKPSQGSKRSRTRSIEPHRITSHYTRGECRAQPEFRPVEKR